MRGVVFTGERGLELMQFPDPTPDAHDVVIEMKASGMCGTDLHQYRRPKGQTQVAGIQEIVRNELVTVGRLTSPPFSLCAKSISVLE